MQSLSARLPFNDIEVEIWRSGPYSAGLGPTSCAVKATHSPSGLFSVAEGVSVTDCKERALQELAEALPEDVLRAE
jgi:hypothetical protein